MDRPLRDGKFTCHRSVIGGVRPTGVSLPKRPLILSEITKSVTRTLSQDLSTQVCKTKGVVAMRTFVVAMQLLIVVGMLSGCAEQPTPQTAGVLDGEWAVRSMKGEGIASSPEEVEGMKWEIAGDIVMATDPNGSTGRMRIALDDKTKSIDITAIEGGNRIGETDLGIYSLETDRLSICLAEPAPEPRRPTAFLANGDSWILELQKVKR